MTSKLNQILESEHLTATKLAEILEIQPSGISHILRNRNKPSYDFVVKLLRRFPRINPDWLLLDSDQMYRNDNTVAEAVKPETKTENTLFDASPLHDTYNKKEEIDQTAFATTADQSRCRSNIKEIDHVIIFYTDQTCECYKTR